MLIKEGWVDNNGVLIHYLESFEVDESLTPLFICPGLSEPAEDYINLMQSLSPRKCIVLSFRGRGRSNCPARGYSLEAHVSDIEAVINQIELKEFYLMGYSRGVSYTLDYAIRNNNMIKGLIIEEYPPLHKKMDDGWAEDIYKAIPDYRLKYNAAIGIERESVQIDFSNLLHLIKCPSLIMRGMKDSSLLTDKTTEVYSSNIEDCEVKTFINAGHDIQTDDYKGYLDAIRDFLSLADKPS